MKIIQKILSKIPEITIPIKIWTAEEIEKREKAQRELIINLIVFVAISVGLFVWASIYSVQNIK